MPELQKLGWDDRWSATWQAANLGGVVPGRVALEHNHVFRVLCEAGDLLAETAGRLKHWAGGRHDLPAVGDWVAVRPDRGGGRALIRAILPRRSAFSRKAAGRETEQQVVAANIDLVLVVFGLDAPLKPRAIERYLTVARQSGASPVVVLNKADLVDDLDGAVAKASAAAGDAPVVATSAHTGLGLAALEARCEFGRTMALLGPSGAGKSSLVNHLVGREVLPTGEVREWDARGRHTSVHRQLVLREAGGLIIDTPGMRELQLWDLDAPVAESFPDIAALAGQCRFRDCRHEQEPGCAVKDAVVGGRLEAERHDSYLKLQREQESLEEKREERGQVEARREARIMGKALKAMQKSRGL